ncbi:sugar transferase [Labilibaculum sp. DW002]|uniref:Sugar transferase n=1 Tax=Paralabilibaculum antarcticum TaxID=2912572 RepID=A0ABT5VRS9_9BACT|nr:sugar transferase [Labilibaculum sp. DW002]MDE5417223.1 sugar transferase [Labilibaculum sp. DW002]
MKSIFDFILALISFIAISPFFLILLVLVYLDTGGPFFKQKRIGKGEKVFFIYKLKSMKDIDEKRGLVSNIDRVTNLGRFIRNASLDELPSLLNILKGDMSFVGPRPLLIEYLPYYKEKHKIRHNVKPGLTGLAQINGRNQTTWEKRLDFDIEYVKKRNFLLDLKILFLTFWKVISKEGVESSVDLSIVRLDQDVEYQNK